MVKEILKEADDKMKKAVEVVRQELVKIRTGKATTTLLEGIKVDYFGTPMQLSHIGNVGVADIHTLTVTPYDKGMLEAAQKAIQSANLGLNPVRDGQSDAGNL
jgi:ribosome recycling factor